MSQGNSLTDMHDLLMDQMRRLACVESDNVDEEVERARSMASLATAINNNASTIIKATQISMNAGIALPKELTAGDV